jgi:diguanylate cyclase (GGDEF)-like protein
MKLKNKTLIVIAVTSLFYLMPVIFLPKNYMAALPYSILSSVFAAGAIYYFIIRKITALNKEIKNIANINDNDLSKRIRAPDQDSNQASDKNSNKAFFEDDEITSIKKNINLLLDNIQASHKLFIQQSNQETKELKNKNAYLEQEMSVLARSEKITSHAESIAQLQQNDTLTSLPNAMFFNEILNKAITYSKRRKKNLAVLLIDLDLFKLVNNTFGKENSDLVLKEISKRFNTILRKEDILAKLEGDEFIILLNDINKPKFASAVAEKLLTACSQLLKVDSHEFTVTASIGISVYPNDGESLQDLIENADRALFKAKQAGGNTYQFHTEEIQLQALEYTQLESALRAAINNNQLSLHYQPKFRVKTGNITGVEALMRWEHPSLGVISPRKFIQLAEDAGLIMQIGEWALREACQRIIYWQNEGYEHLSIALKLSPKQYNHPELIPMLTKVFSSIDINPKYIEFEITEQTIMENIDLANAILEKIKATGVQLSIDHFGIGYTSISYLKQFPITSIKIDQSFIKGIPNKPNDVAITTALIALAHSLGLEVVAEGVETAEQVQFLSAQNCDVMQGYFLSHPVSAQKIIQQFKKLSDEVLG